MYFKLKPYGTDTKIFQKNQVNTMATDALAAGVIRPSAEIVLYV